MNFSNKIVLCLFILFSIDVKAQLSFQGLSTSGIGDNSTSQIDSGMFDFWDARQGLTIADGSNVVTWAGIKGSGYVFSSYGFTNQPSFVSSYTTNNFPAVVFETVGSKVQNLTCHPLAALVTGNVGVTMYMLHCGQTNSGALATISFGYSNATNVQASNIQLRPNAATSTSKSFIYAQDTNSAAPNTTFTGGVDTNVFAWMGYSISNTGSQIVCIDMENLKMATKTFGLNNQTLNTCTMEGLFQTNFSLVNRSRGAITCFVVITNQGRSATAMTNDMNFLNNTYLNGKYKVY